MLLEEYRRSLKMPEAEEVLDLVFYRPFGYLFVKGVYRFPITPNQVTFLSLIAGLVAASFLSIGTASALLMSALWYAGANILDCSDGQLARLQKSGTLLGRVVDGIADYISSIAIFLGVAFGLSRAGADQWWLVIAAGISSALHAILFDYYQSEFISTVRGERNFLEREMERFTLEIHRMKAEHREGVKILVLRLYLSYLRLQEKSSTGKKAMMFNPEEYRAHNRLMIRAWSFLGPTTNRSLLILSCLAGRVEYFLWTITLAGNIWMIVCYLLQRRIHRSMASVAVAASAYRQSGN